VKSAFKIQQAEIATVTQTATGGIAIANAAGDTLWELVIEAD
jgi:hypothetical protein